ncbi:MAG: hypothetical protein AAF721_13115 [Myxococcota bacterium]
MVRLAWSLLLVAAGCGDPDSASSESGSESGGDGPAEVMEPAGMPADAALSDEFDDAATLSQWRIWHEVKGVAATHSLLDINGENAGQLTLRPNAGGWFDDFEAPLVYKMVRGDFMVETQVTAAKVGSAAAPPDQPFNSAGLMARDPESGPGRANWVMFNTGRQRGEQIASEGKTTVDSASVLELIDGPHLGLLRMCRVGAAIVLARQLEGEAAFTVVHRFDRGDLPEDLQVGLVAGGWNSNAEAPDTSVEPDIEARFDYIRFSTIDDEAACTAP